MDEKNTRSPWWAQDWAFGAALFLGGLLLAALVFVFFIMHVPPSYITPPGGNL